MNWNIPFEIVETHSFKIFDSLVKKKTAQFIGIVYEPDYLKFDEYLTNILKIKTYIIKDLEKCS